MPFEQRKLEVSVSQSRGIYNTYIYETTTDTIATVSAAGYFADSRFIISDPQDWFGSRIDCRCTDGFISGFIDDTSTITDLIIGPGAAGGAGFFVPNSATIPFADNAARDAWAAANLGDLIQNQTVVQVTGTPDNVWYLWRGPSDPPSHDNTNWIDVTPLLTGPPGPTGPTGATGRGSLQFSSVAERQTFFSDTANLPLLIQGIPSQITSTDGVAVASYIWGGTTNPMAYDDTLWFEGEVATLPGSLRLGSVRVSQTLNGISIIDGADRLRLITSQVVNQASGITRAQSFVFDAAAPLDISTVRDTTLVAPQTLAFPALLPAAGAMLTLSYSVFPATAGELTIRLWMGNSAGADDETVASRRVTVTAGDVAAAAGGTPKVIQIPGGSITEVGQEVFAEFDGVDLLGGVQTAGIFNGVTAIALSASVMGNGQVINILDQRDITVGVLGDVIAGMVTGGTNTNITVTRNGDVIDFAAQAGGTPLTAEQVEDIVGTMVEGNTETGITVSYDDVNGKLNFIVGTTPPSPGPNDFLFGLSPQSDPALVDFGSLTDVAMPTDPQNVQTGTTTEDLYFHIFSANTHDIQTITDTVLQQIVYQDGGTGNIFTKVNDVRTETAVTYDSYSIGPLNAGVDETYVVRFS